MKNLRILIVDDEAELVYTLAERLQLRGFDVDAATDGEKALHWIETKKYDIALLDMKMPGMGGLSVLKIIRRDHPELPVILLTGHGSNEEANECLRHGALACLFKPVNIDELIETVKQNIRKEK